MSKEQKIVASLGMSLFMVGLGCLVWGGIILENYLFGFIGSAASLMGVALLSKRF